MVMMMTYDYHETSRTSINAPLNRESYQSGNMETVADNVNQVIEQGCDPEKIIMGKEDLWMRWGRWNLIGGSVVKFVKINNMLDLFKPLK